MKICPLCGLRFSEAETQRPCHSCPLCRSCNFICCPNCGYQTPEEPRWLTKVRQHWRQSRKEPVAKAPPPTTSLASLLPGQVAEILEVRPQNGAVLRKLLALGLLPGVRLRIVRAFPCYFLQIGHAQIALDDQLAAVIFVHAD